jgi:hypothetical protein
MEELKTATSVISEALKQNNTLKLKDIKAQVCSALDIKKMGEARWEMILQNGEKTSQFRVDRDKGLVLSISVTSQPSLIEEQTEVPEEIDDTGHKPSEYIKGTRLLKMSATRQREPAEFILTEGARPLKEGDVVWVSTQGETWQGEIKGITQGAVVYPLKERDGYWGYFKADELFDTQAQARVNQNKEKPRYWSSSAMASDDYALFQEFKKHKKEFISWLSQNKQEQTEEDPFEGLFDDSDDN